MNKNSWIIVTDQHRAGGMAAAARKLGGEVTAVVVGSCDLAQAVSGIAYDKVLWVEVAEGSLAEDYAAGLAQAAAAAAPGLVMTTDAATNRMLLAAAAAELNAAIISPVREVRTDGDTIVVTRSAIQGKVVEDIEVQGNVAAVFDGDDTDVPSARPVAVEKLSVVPSGKLKLVEVIEGETSGMLTAARVVGVGKGVLRRTDLPMLEELAQAMHAELGCSLPVCNDKHWFPPERVVGVSHNQIAPDLYFAIGISGSPQHMSGVRDAKVVVAINNDPESSVFENCNYGILGDLYQICPALTEAYKANG